MNNIYIGISIAHWLVLLSVTLSLTGMTAYLLDMFKGKSKPNLVTWGLWGFGPMIATGAALAADADPWATVRIFASGFGPFVIFWFGLFLKQSYWKLSTFDFVCGLFAIGALVAWFWAGSPVTAILLSAIADLFATLPTVIKAWKYPETETFYTYFIGLITAFIVIPAIPVWNIENSAFQIYLMFANTLLCIAVLKGKFFRV